MSTFPPSMMYSATDLTLIIGALSGAIIGIIAGVRLSRCTHIKCGCIEIIKEAPKEKSGIIPPNNSPSNSKPSLTPSESELDLGMGVVV
jgi:hypothetical protein